MWSMPTVAQRAPHPGTRKPLYMSATLALAVEALLLAGVGGWLIHPRTAAPRRPEPMAITLAPPAAQAPNSAPIAAREVSKPVQKPAVQPRRAPAAHQARVAHAAAPKPQPVTAPPAPAQAPDTTPTTPAASAPPAPTAAPAPARPDTSFEASLRAAIEAALRYPESARMDGIAGRTLVGFVYRDGAVSDIHVVTSSGMGQLDHAALAAVRDAVCPPPPHRFEGKSLPEQLWVDFTLDSKG